jgi:hypothetical protein
MRKTLLLLSLGLFGFIQANATISLVNRETQTAASNGDMFHQYGDINETLLHWANIGVINNTGTTTKINMKRYVINAPATVEDYFCWYVCLGSVESATNPVLNHSTGSCFNSNDGDTINYFGGYYKPMGLVTTAVYRYVWFNASNPNDSAYIDLTYHATPVSVNEFAKNVSMTTFPNPANEVLNLNLENIDFSSTVTAEIFDIIGNKVISQNITSVQTKVDVSELPQGSYICTLVSNRKTILTKKVMISH